MLLIASLLNLFFLDSMRANQHAANSKSMEEQILAWKQMIDEQPDADYKITLSNGKSHHGKLQVYDGGLLINRRKFITLSEEVSTIVSIRWENIESMEYYTTKSKIGRTSKVVLIGLAGAIGFYVLYCFTPLGGPW